MFPVSFLCSILHKFVSLYCIGTNSVLHGTIPQCLYRFDTNLIMPIPFWYNLNRQCVYAYTFLVQSQLSVLLVTRIRIYSQSLWSYYAT